MKNLIKRFENTDVMSIFWSIAGFLITIIRGLLIVGGGAIAASLADVILGALTLDLLLVNTEGTIDAVKYAPIVLSMGASGVQLILWQIVQKRGGLRQVFASKDLVSKLVFGGVIAMKFADDFMDISIVNYLMIGSLLPGMLGWWFIPLKGAVLFITWMLTGFSEIFVVNAIEIMKATPKQEQKQETKQEHHQQHNKPKHVAPFYFDERTRNELLRNREKK